MGYYISVIEMALTYFPLVSALFILPYLIVAYRKYGRIHSWHVVVNLLAVYYLLTVFCLVNLPFPDSLDYVIREPQLHFGQWWQDFTITQRARGGSYAPLQILSNSVIYQQIFNIIMFIPLGIYLRYVRRQRFWVVLIASLAFSLLLEVIQLSGFFFLFPGAYRSFDVDDLFMNVVGGVIGYVLGKIPQRYYPLEQRYTPSVVGDISLMPKILSATVDILTVMGINWLIGLVIKDSFSATVLVGVLYCIWLPYLWHGNTLGRFLLQIKLMPGFGRKKTLQLKDIIIKHIPILLTIEGYYFFILYSNRMPGSSRVGYLGLYLLLIILYWGVSLLKGEQLLFDKWSTLKLCPAKRERPL